MEEYRITIAGQSKYEIELCAVQCGRDYSVTICGGGRHHVGAAALGCDESGTVGHKMRGRDLHHFSIRHVHGAG